MDESDVRVAVLDARFEILLESVERLTAQVEKLAETVQGLLRWRAYLVGVGVAVGAVAGAALELLAH